MWQATGLNSEDVVKALRAADKSWDLIYDTIGKSVVLGSCTRRGIMLFFDSKSGTWDLWIKS